jgi:hypothetical protein
LLTKTIEQRITWHLDTALETKFIYQRQ